MGAAEVGCAGDAERPAAAEGIEAPLGLLAELLAAEIAAALDRRVLTQGALPRLALSPEEAARALGVSRDFFDRHVLPELRVVRRGRRRLVPLRELERWLEQAAGRALTEER
jgi:excisionase family DNA binding protein